MRVVLVGPDAERVRLRVGMNGSADVVGEFPTLPSARAAALDVDAFILSPSLVALDFSPAVAEQLTPRELQVLSLLAEGLPNKSIAARLGISDQTVKFHVAAISGKLGASNRTEAVRLAFRRGLVML
ncbi:MAG TPA: response regulator transcription factor [Vicinamibacterales bacterium]|jgi:DNA-binding NarL/FixJ family response regulator|nr:response regulator transcription factor [Vicinamibacterales bacterium]